MPGQMDEREGSPSNFIKEIIREHNVSGRFDGKVITRFPPEPNGYLHIGHAKSICLNFGLAREYGGRCHLRFDDTNPTRENEEYVESIKYDVRWLGFDWGEHLYFASDYFQQLYDWACRLISQGDAYVCDLSPEEIRQYRGTLNEPGRESPYRNRSEEENLDLFARMRRESSQRERSPSGRRSTWPAAILTCEIRCCTGSSTPPITGPEAPGIYTLPTISPTDSPIPLKA